MSERDERCAELLAHGALEVHGRFADSSNTTLLVTASIEDRESLAVFKPERGERPLWDFESGLWRREVAAFELSELLGFGGVPLTVARDDADFGVGSMQRFVEGASDEHYFTVLDRTEFHDYFVQLAAFDVVANNTDRKSGHVLVTDDRCYAIDNGLCFHVEDKLRTVIWDFAGTPLPEALVPGLERVANGELEVLAGLLATEELEATARRARELLDLGELPEPDDSRPYPPWPWPVV